MNPLMVLLALAANADAATTDALGAGIDRRQASYRNAQFEYITKNRVVLSKEATNAKTGMKEGQFEFREVFRIMDPASRDASLPWKAWERRVEGEGGRWVPERFAVFDGTKTSLLERKEGESRNGGLVLPFYDWTRFQDDILQQFLFIAPTAVEKYRDSVRPYLKDFDFRVVNKKSTDGRDLFELQGQTPNGTQLRILVSGDPDYMVLRFEARAGDRQLKLLEVKEVKTAGSITYPAAGSYHQWPIGQLPDHSCDFTVTAVTHLTDAARRSWVPAWPPGTEVNDHVNNRSFEIKPDK